MKQMSPRSGRLKFFVDSVVRFTDLILSCDTTPGTEVLGYYHSRLRLLRNRLSTKH
jgi:hypothetical protein